MSCRVVACRLVSFRVVLSFIFVQYVHGTGHGVGAFLNVHEGPQRISRTLQTGEQALLPGMTMSNEPGYYDVRTQLLLQHPTFNRTLWWCSCSMLVARRCGCHATVWFTLWCGENSLDARAPKTLALASATKTFWWWKR